MREVRGADEQAGEEGAQRQRESHRLRQRRRAEADGQRDQEKQLLIARTRHARQQRRHHAAGDRQERHEDEGGDAEPASDRHQPVGRQRAQRRHERHQDDRRQVLDEADPDQHAAVPRVQLPAIEQQPRQHHRARHRDHDADHEPLQRRPAQDHADGHRQADVQHGPDRATDQRDPLHPQQVLERELDADREHQEDDADLGEDLEVLVRVGDGRPRRELADGHAAQHVAEHQRLPREPRQGAAEHRRDQDERKVAEEDGVGRHARMASSSVGSVRSPRPAGRAQDKRRPGARQEPDATRRERRRPGVGSSGRTLANENVSRWECTVREWAMEMATDFLAMFR